MKGEESLAHLEVERQYGGADPAYISLTNSR